MVSEDSLECPECGNNNLVRDESTALVCSDCGYVVEEGTHDYTTPKEVEENSHTQPPKDTVIIALISQPDESYQEYYRIENAKEFFEGCWGNEAEMDRQIAESDIEPFATLDVPQPDWVIGM